MLLKEVKIHKYKSFITEQSFSVENKITRIVGKNESGKSAILEAIAKTNYFEDNQDFKFKKEFDYPRSELAGIRNDFPKAITCSYELEEDDIIPISNEFTPGLVNPSIIYVTTNYDNTYTFSGVSIELSKFKEWITEKGNLDAQGIELLSSSSSISMIYDVITEHNDVSGFNTIKSVLDSLRKNPKDECFFEKYIFSNYIEKSLPKMWYFDEYYSLPGRINLSDYANNNCRCTLKKEEYQIVKALFELSNLSVSDIQSETDYENFKSHLESTSNLITDEMFEYWTTNKNLDIEFNVEHVNERILNIRVRNRNYRVSLPLGNRSKGFLWFFSFLIWFSKIQGDKNKKYILLLDEPGLSLHASAQDDLLRFIDEKLSVDYQIIYTTHSPFMIDSEKLNEIRTVYDTQDPKVGSKISEAVQEKDPDTLFPLQAALGYTIAQNLYISKNNLLVEGISDLTYLEFFSSILKANNRKGLNENITIVPVGGADKIATFISLMRGNKLSTVCLLDSFKDQSAKARLEKMHTENIISKRKIIYYSDVIDCEQADVEDMFTKSEYLQLYNGAFNTKVEESSLKSDKPILDQLKKKYSENRNHYLPANFLLKHVSEISFSDETLNRFEKLFDKINDEFSSKR